MTEIVVKRNPLEMLQPCPVLTMKPIKSAKLEEHFNQRGSRHSHWKDLLPTQELWNLITPQLTFQRLSLLSHLCCLSWTLQFLILIQFQRDPSVAGAILQHNIPRKTTDGYRRENKKTFQVYILPFPPKKH